MSLAADVHLLGLAALLSLTFDHFTLMTGQGDNVCRRNARALPGIHVARNAERAGRIQLPCSNGDPAAGLPRS